jgi:hypothetical protein
MLKNDYNILRRPFVFRNTDYQDFMIIQCEDLHKQLFTKLGIKSDRKLNRRGMVVDADQETEEESI